LVSRIINQLAVDADKFFDEVAFLNDALVKEEEKSVQANGKKSSAVNSSDSVCGLSKRLFFGQLAEYGVALSE
jgi:hypothetical protein